jgi:DNA-binding MarR family transcriptional regulator
MLSHHMTEALHMLSDEFDRGLAHTDLRGVQLPYLWCVCEHPGVSQEVLANKLGVNGSNVARQMSELARLGYITRQKSPEDGRAWLIAPTDRAYEILPLLVDIMNDAQEALLRGLSFEERELLCELVTRMDKNVARREAEVRRESK